MVEDIGLAYPFGLAELEALPVARLVALRARARAHLELIYRAAGA